MAEPQATPPQPTSQSWLDVITAPPVAIEQAVAPAEQSLDDEKNYVQKRRRLELKDLEQDIEARKGYANKLFWLIAIWLFAILEILTAVGLGRILWMPFKLSDAVLLALIGSTTATVIGLFLVVVNYLFPQRQKPPAG